LNKADWQSAHLGELSDKMSSVELICTNCGNRFQNAPGDPKHFQCSICGNLGLVRIQTEQERQRDALAGAIAGAAVGAAILEVPGAVVGGIVGFILGFFRTPPLQQVRK
jgi:transcription elongation factor Elf1